MIEIKPVNGFIRFFARRLIHRKILIVKDFLTQEECDLIRAEMRAGVSSKAKVVTKDGEVVNENIRSAENAIVSPSTLAQIEERLQSIKPRFEQRFGLSLDSLQKPSFLIYRKGGFYKVHKDGQDRKVSIVLFLNDPSGHAEGYAGGPLLFCLLNRRYIRRIGFSLKCGRGCLVAFPSQTRHEVKPVTRGERMTIVSWYR